MRLSERYISDRFLPDKAIDVVDEACSKASLRGFKIPESIYELEELTARLRIDVEEAVRRSGRGISEESGKRSGRKKAGADTPSVPEEDFRQNSGRDRGRYRICCLAVDQSAGTEAQGIRGDKTAEAGKNAS